MSSAEWQKIRRSHSAAAHHVGRTLNPWPALKRLSKIVNAARGTAFRPSSCGSPVPRKVQRNPVGAQVQRSLVLVQAGVVVPNAREGIGGRLDEQRFAQHHAAREHARTPPNARPHAVTFAMRAHLAPDEAAC